jgi:CRISPR-associated protein Cas1
MESVIVNDFGVMLGRTSERLVVRGPRPRLDLVEGGPQLFLPLDLPPPRRSLQLVTSSGIKEPAPSLRLSKPKPGSRAAGGGPEQVELPFFRISEIVVASRGVTISSDLIEECCDRGIRICFLSSGGQPFAMLSSPMLTATVQTRREQMSAYGDARGLELARAIVLGKLKNQANLLKYFGKYQKDAAPDTFKALGDCVRGLVRLCREVRKVSGARVDDSRAALMAIEGASGRLYWAGVRALIGERTGFSNREHRGATDCVNCALNYGYGILYSQVWGALMNAGLEPFAGFLHVDRPGKPSLVLDLIEEFRQPIVDRAVIALAGKGVALEMQAGMLAEQARQTVAGAVLERLDSEVAFRGRRHLVRSVMQIQARRVASFLRGEGSYRPFSFKW